MAVTFHAVNSTASRGPEALRQHREAALLATWGGHAGDKRMFIFTSMQKGLSKLLFGFGVAAGVDRNIITGLASDFLMKPSFKAPHTCSATFFHSKIAVVIYSSPVSVSVSFDQLEAEPVFLSAASNRQNSIRHQSALPYACHIAKMYVYEICFSHHLHQKEAFRNFRIIAQSLPLLLDRKQETMPLRFSCF